MDPCNLVLISFDHSKFIRGISRATSQLSLPVENFYSTQQEEIYR